MVAELALMLGVASCGNTTGTPKFEGRNISQLIIWHEGKQTIDESLISRCIHSKPGSVYSADHLEADIKSLYESGLVKDVRFLGEPDGYAVKLIAIVSTRPGFGPPLCVGNTVFSDLRLAKASKLRTDLTMTPENIEAARLNIERFYIRNGYYDAKVVTRFPWAKRKPYAPAKLGDFVFAIEEGSGVKR